MKLDILCFAAHPDDVELSCSGTILKAISNGKRVGIVDLTQGELGTRGSAELRLKEAAESAKILGLSARENLGMADGFFERNKKNQIKIIEMIRKYQPDIVMANAIEDRHIDHGRAAKLVSEACFLSGLRKIETNQDAWRPKAVYHYIQDRYLKPDFVIDITEHWDQKKDSIKAFASQFYNPNSKEPISPIATEDFLHFLEARAREFGRPIGAKYAEGYTVERILGVGQITDLV